MKYHPINDNDTIEHLKPSLAFSATSSAGSREAPWEVGAASPISFDHRFVIVEDIIDMIISLVGTNHSLLCTAAHSVIGRCMHLALLAKQVYLWVFCSPSGIDPMTFGPTIPICVVQSSLRVWWKYRNSGPPNQSKIIFIDHDIAQGVDKLFPDDCGRLDNGRGALCFGDAVLCRQRKSPLYRVLFFTVPPWKWLCASSIGKSPNCSSPKND